MSEDHSINFQSLNVVQDELIATIESSAGDLENFVTSEQEDLNALQASINGVQQIAGILKVLELKSASMLADELLNVANTIPLGANGKPFEKKLEVISNTFFILTRYLEYLQQVKYQVPELLIPHINALRKLCDEPPLSESHFQTIGLPAKIDVPGGQDTSGDLAESRADIRRARHMYQIGLTGLIREKQVNNSLALMRRAVKKVARLGSSTLPLAKLWWFADVALETVVARRMSLLETRKYLFIRLDKVFRQLELSPDKAFHTEPPGGLMKELLYIVVLGGHDSQAAKSLTSQCTPLLKLPYTEKELQKEYAALYGPSSHTISSLSYVLQTEIANAKRTLENAAQSSSSNIEDLDSFISVLVNIAEILGVVGLNQASASLKEHIEIVRGWRGGQAITTAVMTSVANNLLYVESLVQDLRNADLNHDQSGSTDQTRDAQIASHELSSAVHIVIEESLGGLSLTKRALNSFSDSNYDVGHIKNISRTLNGIRGAMLLMKLFRVSDILKSSAEFVDEILLENEPPAAINEVLETFADVIISVEYYLDSANSQGEMDDSVLKVAEESLDALGFEVSD